jgi:hypothetical protein
MTEVKASKRRMRNSLAKQNNLPLFAKSANAMHIEMTEHSTCNK